MQHTHSLEINGQTIHIVFGNAPAVTSAPPAKRAILSRKDLPFCKLVDGTWRNWYVPKRQGQWNDGYTIGQQWFDDVRELAKTNPQAALNAIRAAGTDLCRYADHGHERGFMDQLALWAMHSILAHDELPPLRHGRRTVK